MDTIKRREALGAAIKAQRVNQGLSQERLAFMIGSSKAHIWRIEKGSVGVGLDDLCRIADALDTKVSELMPF